MKKIAAHLKAKLSARLSRTPLWVSFMLMTSLLLLASTLLLSLFNYNYSRSGSIREYNTQSERLLNLKAQNLKSYLDNLSEFCVLPVTDNTFYQQLHQTVPLSEAAQQDILQKVQTYYYTRTDLNAYHLYMLNQNLVIGRSSGDQRIKMQSAPDMDGNQQLEMCLKAKSGTAISPASGGSLFVFSHTIIRISDRTPLAAAVIEVTPSALLSGMEGTNITLYSGGTLLYTSAKGDLGSVLKSPNAPDSVLARGPLPKDGLVRIGDEQYLCSAAQDETYGVRLVSLQPISSIEESFRRARTFSLLEGFLFLMVSLFLTYFSFRFLTAPLAQLSVSQKKLGKGQFLQIRLGRSLEVARLSDSFNQMSAQIEKLIRENLIASLNEKTAKLTALEAQLNPHFLNNTLQAIGSEALMCDQIEIYDMVTKLAQIFRYALKAGNQVPLREEMVFTQNYIDLQKLRMNDRLDVRVHIREDLLDVTVPKCCVQLLVENAILHGITGDRSSIHIQIEATETIHEDNPDGASCFNLTVSDDGAGIPADRLQEIRRSLKAPLSQTNAGSIGLVNLSSRLKLMAPEASFLQIESVEGTGTRVSLVMNLQRSRTNVQSIDH